MSICDPSKSYNTFSAATATLAQKVFLSFFCLSHHWGANTAKHLDVTHHVNTISIKNFVRFSDFSAIEFLAGIFSNLLKMPPAGLGDGQKPC